MAVRYELDAATARLILRTATEGVFSPLAHDLEIEAGVVRGEATLDGEAWTADVIVRASDLRVVGVVKRGRVDTAALSPKDRSEIERRIRDEALAPLREIAVAAEGRGASGTARVRGARVAVRFERTEQPGGAVETRGDCALSLRALGVGELKGPLGMFRVADAVAVRFTARWVRAA